MIDIWVYYTAVCERPPPCPHITSSYRFKYLSSHAKKSKIKYKTLYKILNISFRSNPSTPKQFIGCVCKSQCLLFHFHLFINILPHSYIMHFTALLLHWPGWKRRCNDKGNRVGIWDRRGEWKGKKAINISNKVYEGSGRAWGGGFDSHKKQLILNQTR